MEKRKNTLVTICFCILAGYLIFQYAYTSILLGKGNDYASHVHTLIAVFRAGDWTKGWMMAPHCLWHITTLFLYGILNIPMDTAGALATGMYTMLYYGILVWSVKRVLAHFKYEAESILIPFLCFVFCYLQCFSVSWSDVGDGYLGPFTMNPLHSPTHMSVRVFSLLAFCIVIDLLQGFGKKEYEPIFFKVSVVKQRVLLAVFLFLSVVMKPTFAEMFIPAVAFYMLGVWIYKLCKKDQPGTYFTSCLWMLLCAAPSLVYMLIQYIVFFAFGNSYGNDGALIVTQWWEVWHLYSENVVLAIVFAMAFPIYMLLIDMRYFLKEVPGRIALLGYGIAFLEASFLGEDGDRLGHANFMWPYMSAMQLLWMVAFWRLLVLEKRDNKTKLQGRLLLVGWILFFAHGFYGYLMY